MAVPDSRWDDTNRETTGYNRYQADSDPGPPQSPPLFNTAAATYLEYLIKF